jgi:hypothetical protein
VLGIAVFTVFRKNIKQIVYKASITVKQKTEAKSTEKKVFRDNGKIRSRFMPRMRRNGEKI